MSFRVTRRDTNPHPLGSAFTLKCWWICERKKLIGFASYIQNTHMRSICDVKIIQWFRWVCAIRNVSSVCESLPLTSFAVRKLLDNPSSAAPCIASYTSPGGLESKWQNTLCPKALASTSSNHKTAHIH